MGVKEASPAKQDVIESQRPSEIEGQSAISNKNEFSPAMMVQRGVVNDSQEHSTPNMVNNSGRIGSPNKKDLSNLSNLR